MKTGLATLPLHYGKAPWWLFGRMKKLGYEIVRAIVEEDGPEEFLTRLGNPFWFQSLGCVLGYDWHSSGLTTVVCAALKEALWGTEHDLGIFVAGGKGQTSRKTPQELEKFGQDFSFDPGPLVYASKTAAKVDSAAVQDGYQLYHHTFFFYPNKNSGKWAVIQQGMNPLTRMARRYHWLSDSAKNFVLKPHSAICCDQKGMALDLTAQESQPVQKTSVEILTQQSLSNLNRDLQALSEFAKGKNLSKLDMPTRHFILGQDYNTPYLRKITHLIKEYNPASFERLLNIKGVGPKTIRALALISELIYGEKPSYEDPARYAFAHGGKDGTPFPVDRKTYDSSIEFLDNVTRKANLPRSEKRQALRRLYKLVAVDGRLEHHFAKKRVSA